MERDEENFLFSIVEGTSLEKRKRERESERGKSGVSFRVCSCALAVVVTSRQE
jgi:hypothetical protein